jgi:hypothetical protein
VYYSVWFGRLILVSTPLAFDLTKCHLWRLEIYGHTGICVYVCVFNVTAKDVYSCCPHGPCKQMLRDASTIVTLACHFPIKPPTVVVSMQWCSCSPYRFQHEVLLSFVVLFLSVCHAWVPRIALPQPMIRHTLALQNTMLIIILCLTKLSRLVCFLFACSVLILQSTKWRCCTASPFADFSWKSAEAWKPLSAAAFVRPFVVVFLQRHYL